MRKIIGMLFLAFAFSVCQVHAEETDVTKMPILTGEIWMKSSAEEKRAFIFGIDTAIAVEYTVDARFKERFKNSHKDGEKAGDNTRKRRPTFLSRFERGWMKALKDMPRKELIATVDAWYTQHENSLDRPVMGLIWEEIVEPRLEKTRAKK